jgi:prepilin-type N-terminal cleavage/methylation domain-containing protein
MQVSPNDQIKLRPGFTLIELIISTAILAIILVGMHSAMLIASRASPDRAGVNSATLRAGAAADQLIADLTYATSITSTSATAVQFTVPDRNDDGSPDTIRYSWSGVSGAGLMRTVNGGTPAAIAADVREFSLAYDKRPQPRSPTSSESGEVLLSSYDASAGLLGLGGLADQKITSSTFVGQYFKPSLPGAATGWRVTRVRLKAQSENSGSSGGLLGGLLGGSGSSSGGAGVTRVQIRTVSPGGTPATILDETTLLESSLVSSYAWQNLSFTGVANRPPGSGLCIVLQWSADTEACDVQYDSQASGSTQYLLRTTNGGTSWSASAGQDLQYYVYGTYTTTDPIVTDYLLTDVRCTVRVGGDAQSRLNTTIRVLNEPQVSGP